jgi:hypothetical protein
VTRSTSSALLAFVLATTASAQEAAPPELATPQPQRPGLLRVGPFYLTPFFQIGTIGLDTNVFYTATDRQTDVMASGGPGLELVLPLGGLGRFVTRGALDYLYFVRTQSQRRLNGNGVSRLELKGSRTEVSAEEDYLQTFSRPNYEVNARVQQTQEGTRADLKRRLFGRISLMLGGSRAHNQTDPGQIYLGTDLARTLTLDSYRAAAGLGYAITVKTSFVVEGDQQWDRFPLDASRGADSNRLAAGFRTDTTALIFGHALFGARWFRPKDSSIDKRVPYVDVDALWSLSPRTKFGGSYNRDLNYSAFITSGATPTVSIEAVGFRIEKQLVGNLDLRLFARQTLFTTDGTITLDVPGQGKLVSVRDDRAREAGADLGYRFRPRVRAGVTASYIDRRSTISYFGIKGLLVGFTAQYQP